MCGGLLGFYVYVLFTWTCCWTNRRVAGDWDAVTLMWQHCNVLVNIKNQDSALSSVPPTKWRVKWNNRHKSAIIISFNIQVDHFKHVPPKRVCSNTQNYPISTKWWTNMATWLIEKATLQGRFSSSYRIFSYPFFFFQNIACRYLVTWTPYEV